MELFKIGYGPWKMLFSGTFQDHPVEIYTNPEAILLVLIGDMQGGKAKGAVVELFKAFYAIGEAEAFVETLPREVVMLTKHSEKENLKFLLLGSSAVYVQWQESRFITEVDMLLKRLETSAALIKDVSQAYDLKLAELNACSEEIRAAFFSQPLLAPLISTSTQLNREYAEEVGPARGEIIMGLTKDRVIVVEPLELFTKTGVFEGTEKERKHVLHIIAEGALLSNIPVILFDFNDEFSGLGQATSGLDGLKKYKVEIEPIGFPIKHFELAGQVVIDLNLTNPEGMVQTMGIGSNQAGRLISATLKTSKVKGITDLIERVKATAPGEEPTAYQINRAVRMLKVISLRYPDLFEGSPPIEEMSRGWMKGIGRAGILRLNKADARVALLAVHSITKGLLRVYSAGGETRKIKAFVIMPEISNHIPRTAGNAMHKEISAAMVEMSKRYGVAYAISADKPIDIANDVLENTEARIEVVNANDVGVQLKGRKRYRVFMRPALSTCTER